MENVAEKKPTTLEDLANQMAEGIKKSDDRFATLEQQMAEGFKKSDDRFATLEQQMAEGFKKVDEKFEDLDNRVANGFADAQSQISTLSSELAIVKVEMEGLRNSVNNYLKLSDEQYLELKHRQDVIVGWVAKLAERNNIPINLKELDYK